MSTNARIGVKNADGTILSIYCHNDGYPEHILPILTEHYNTENMVRSLIALGDISVLGSRLHPDPAMPHAFMNRQPDVVTAYHRDRNEPWVDTKPAMSGSEKEYLQMATPYKYLYDCGSESWRCAHGDAFLPATDTPATEGERHDT